MEDKDKLVWHYTNIDTAYKILSSGLMRATYYTGLNDRLDVKYGLGIAIEILQKMKSEEKHFIVLNKILQKLYDAAYPNLWYVMCFSYDGDSIPQWQGYTDRKNGGCAIGFERKILDDKLFLDNEDGPPNVSNFYYSWVDCIYSKTVIKKKIINTLNQLKENLKNLKQYEAFAESKMIMEPNNGLLSVGTRVAIANIAVGAKHFGFKHEKEYRLYFKADENHRSILTEALNKRYIECKLNNKYLSAIKCIRLSPHGNKELNRLIIENILASYPQYNFEIDESKMPYRGN